MTSGSGMGQSLQQQKGQINVPEIQLQLSLTRASGILAGIVAAMAKENLSLQTQKIIRNASDSSARLDIVCEGEILDIEALTTRIEGCLGVARLEFASADGVAMVENGERVESIDDSSQFTAAEPDDESVENAAPSATELPGEKEESSGTDETAKSGSVIGESRFPDTLAEPAASQFSEMESSPEPVRDPEVAEITAIEPVNANAVIAAESHATESTEKAVKPKKSGYRRRRRLR